MQVDGSPMPRRMSRPSCAAPSSVSEGTGGFSRQGKRAVRSTARRCSVRPVPRIRSSLSVMRRTYRYRLYPTGRQAAALTLQLGEACDLYNAALEHRRRLWREHGVSVGLREQSAELKAMRADGLLDATVNFWSQQAVLKRLDRAFAAFYRRCKAGEKPGIRAFGRVGATTRSSTASRVTPVGSRSRRGPSSGAGCRAHQGETAPRGPHGRRALRSQDHAPQRPLVRRDQPQGRARPAAAGDGPRCRRGCRDHDVRRDERP